MPRTKLQRKTKNETKNDKKKLKELMKMVRNHHDEQLERLKDECIRKQLAIPKAIANITTSEFEQRDFTNNYTNSLQVICRSRLPKENSRFLTLRRSNSFDEGYITAGSSRNTTDERASRLMNRQTRPRRLSKSSSPPKLTSTSTLSSVSAMRKYRTPCLQPPPNTYGTVTPKVNPNTPQVLLRRPKHGEMVLSLQGSPLYAGAVVSEDQANINIPLEDGKLLTLQPQRGLRMSQIPELDPKVAEQLKMLRDNLNKVCAASVKRK